MQALTLWLPTLPLLLGFAHNYKTMFSLRLKAFKTEHHNILKTFWGGWGASEANQS